MGVQNLSKTLASTRSYAQIQRDRINQMLEQERYEIWCQPKSGEMYEPERSWPDKISKSRTLRNLYDHENAVHVFMQVPGGSAQDVSEDFARMMVADMHAQGHDFDAMTVLPPFISAHLSWEDVWEEIAQ